MKLLKSLFAIALFFTMNAVSAQVITDKWKAMNEYHALLYRAFQPAEEGNFNMIKSSSEELVAKSDLLDVATMPQELRTPKVDQTIAILKKQTKFVNELVKNKAPNAEIMRAFENLYDIYNRIAQMCEPGR